MDSIQQKDDEYYSSLKNKTKDFPSSEISFTIQGTY